MAIHGNPQITTQTPSYQLVFFLGFVSKMVGAIFQLKTKGPQDSNLTAKPVLNFFVKEYSQYVNFSSETVSLDFNESVDFGKKLTMVIPRKGDFLHRLHIDLTLPALTETNGTFAGWTNSVGHSIIQYVDIEIGNQIIDRHYGLFMEIWNELTVSTVSGVTNNELIGKYNSIESLKSNATLESNYSIPLQFWFCKNLNLALPLLMLQYHQVRLILKLNSFNSCIVYDGSEPPADPGIASLRVTAEYIYLDDTQRLKYLNTSKTILIDQIQTCEANQTPGNGIFKAKVNFNHPVKELFWVFRETLSEENNDWFNFSQRNSVVNTKVLPLMKNAKIILDGTDRCPLQSGLIYQAVNCRRYHTNVTDKYVYSYSFCDKPEDHQPSGTLNFSLVDDAIVYCEMEPNINDYVMITFCRNYNWLVINSGKASLMYLT